MTEARHNRLIAPVLLVAATTDLPLPVITGYLAAAFFAMVGFVTAGALCALAILFAGTARRSPGPAARLSRPQPQGSWKCTRSTT